LLGKLVDAVDRAALVAAGDDQRALHPGHGLRDGGNDKALPLSAQIARVEFAGDDQRIDGGILAERTDEDQIGGAGARRGNGWFARSDPLHVGLQIADGPYDPGPVGRIVPKRRGALPRHERESGGRRGVAHDERFW
jgi:hypothetical protein